MSDPAAIRIRLEQDADFAFKVSFPGTDLDNLLTDEPEPLGHDRGPNPSRLLLAAIGNCMAASLLFALRKHDNQTVGLVAEVTATMMRNAEGRWRIPRASVELHLPGQNSDYRRLERILAQFEEFCVVTQSVRQGIEVEVSVVDGDGRVLLGDRSFEAGA
jgi:uncharacterized OsmC-like protein